MRTSKVGLRSIKEENGQDFDQVGPIRLVTVYRLVVAKASPFLTVEVGITGICYRVPSSRSQSSIMHGQ